MSNRLKIGDIVTFYFSDDSEITGCLDYIASSFGDCWIIIVKGNPVYVQHFDMLMLANKSQ